MKDTVKLALILFAFCAVCAGLLAVANGYTSVIIAERQADQLTDSLGVVYESADSFEESDRAKLAEIQENNPNVLNIYDAVQGGSVAGNVVEMRSSGYGGAFRFLVGLDRATGAVTGFSMLEHSESPGFGARAEEPAFAEGTVGATSGAEIEALSGATVTTSAVQAGIDQAFEAVGMLSGELTQLSPEEQQAASLQAAFPEADSLEETEVSGAAPEVESVHTALSGGSPVGHVVVVKEAGGYEGDITFALGVNNDGAITGFKSIEHNETPGMGARMDEPEFAEAMVGKTDAAIDAIAGATFTSEAIKAGIEKALAAAEMAR